MTKLHSLLEELKRLEREANKKPMATWVDFEAYDEALRNTSPVLIEACETALEIIKLVTIQTTSAEYAQECGDELDGNTAIEAWDGLILDVRDKTAKLDALCERGIPMENVKL